MTITILLISFLENNKTEIEGFNNLQISLFVMYLTFISLCVFYYGKEFFSTYFNVIDNITATEKDDGFISSKLDIY